MGNICSQLRFIKYESYFSEVKKDNRGSFDQKLTCVVKELLDSKEIKQKLYLYSSGGGGHISAKNALRDRYLSEVKGKIYKKIEEDGTYTEEFKGRFRDLKDFVQFAREQKLFKEKDTLHDFLGFIGRQATKKWDKTQKNGDVVMQEKLASMQRLSDIIFGPIVFYQTLVTLIRFQPEEVISTQAMANNSILKAISIYNSIFKKKSRDDLKLDLYMTDMPTVLSSHFFAPIRKMSEARKILLRLHAPKPRDDFDWTDYGLKDVDILDPGSLPIRPAFLDALHKFKREGFHPEKIQIKVSSEKERELLEQTVGAESIQGRLEKGEHFVDYSLGKEDDAFFIMLGSQPTKSAVEEYLERFIEKAKQNEGEPAHLFLFAGKFQDQCFYRDLTKKIQDADIPSNLKVVPLSYQDADQIVGFFARCDSYTRSGGATCMELLVMDLLSKSDPNIPERKRYIHAQTVSGRPAVESIPLWERGNYLYLRELIGAEVITPEILSAALKR